MDKDLTNRTLEHAALRNYRERVAVIWPKSTAENPSRMFINIKMPGHSKSSNCPVNYPFITIIPDIYINAAANIFSKVTLANSYGFRLRNAVCHIDRVQFRADFCIGWPLGSGLATSTESQQQICNVTHGTSRLPQESKIKQETLACRSLTPPVRGSKFNL
jgi:hypothetical protein